MNFTEEKFGKDQLNQQKQLVQKININKTVLYR